MGTTILKTISTTIFNHNHLETFFVFDCYKPNPIF